MKGMLEYLNDPERRAATMAKQRELRGRFGANLAQHPAEANFIYGQGRVQMALDQLNAIRHRKLKSGGRARRNELHDQIAEGLALQGEFKGAAAIAVNKERKAEYKLKATAFASLGQDTCECPAQVSVPSIASAKGTLIETEQKIEEIWDAETKRTISLYLCHSCGAITARSAL